MLLSKRKFSFNKIPKLPLKKVLKKSMSSIGTIYKYKNPPFQFQQYSSKINPLKYKFHEMNKEFKENWRKLKNELNCEIDNVEMEFNIELNKQKIQTTLIKYEIKKLKQLMWDNQSLLTQLKTRIKDLKYKIDGE